MSTPQVIYPGSRYLSKLYVSTILVFLIFILPWILLGLIPELGWIYVLIFILANAGWMAPTFLLLPFYCKSIQYQIGEDEIVVQKGIFTRSVKTIPYRTITDFIVKRDILDRWLFNLGTLDVQTAGRSGQTGAEASLVGLTKWDELRNEILPRLRAYRISSGIGTEVERKLAGSAETELLQQILAELRGLRQDLRR